MRRFVTISVTIVVGLSAVGDAAARTTTRRCGSWTAHGLTCGQARKIMYAWQNSYANPGSARFRYGSNWWSCSLGKARKGKQLAFCASGQKWFRASWPANYTRGQGRNGCQPKPVLYDLFDGSGDGYALDFQLNVVDVDATRGIGCAFASNFYTYSYSYSHSLLRGSDGANHYTYGGYTWRCTTYGVAGDAQVNNWSDIDINCTSLPSKQTTLPQWLDMDVGSLPGVSCSSTTYGPAISGSPTADSICPYSGYAWNDSGSGGNGSRAAGLKDASYSDCSAQVGECSWGTMSLPIPGAEDRYGLCIWKDVGPVSNSQFGYEEYTCVFGQA
jgi:hypothetical protein